MNKLITACYVEVSTRLLEISGYYEIVSLVGLTLYILLGGVR